MGHFREGTGAARVRCRLPAGCAVWAAAASRWSIAAGAAWPGGIAERGVREVDATAAAIGPGIGRCCFEVGEEVLAEFSHLGDDIADGRMLDLGLVCERLLRNAGVTQIERSGLCTSCERELFFSHRRDDGVTGRQAGIVCRWPS